METIKVSSSSVEEQKKILVVDDEKDILEIVKAILEGEGHQVKIAETGEKALAAVKSDNSIDLVITDIRMPGRYDGINLFNEIRKKFPFRPAVVFITGFFDIPEEDAYAMGACGFIRKPFKRQEICDVVKSVFKRALVD